MQNSETPDTIEEAIKSIKKATEIIAEASDEELAIITTAGCFDEFINSIFNPQLPCENIFDYLLKNKKRAEIIAEIWYLLIKKYGFHLLNENKEFAGQIISPYFAQWYDDGIMLVLGNAPFKGQILLYQNGEIRYGVSARDAVDGELLGPKDIKFISQEEVDKSFEKNKIKSFSNLEEAIYKLETLLKKGCADESEYQSLLEENPWMFGATYDKIDSHLNLDDEDIPDFTGVRVRDGCRDIIEIKQPFLKLFRNDGKFSANFHQSLDQTEGYLDFANNQRQYLIERKGLRFENPEGYILMGYNLSEDQIREIRRKERSRKDITFYTYNDLLNSAKKTLEYYKNLKQQEKLENTDSLQDRE
jgi:hypothetical protein